MGDGGGRRGTLVAARSQHAWAALLLGGCVLAYLWPVLVGGRVLAANAVLYLWPPWAASAPGDLNSYLNPLLTDAPMANYPWRVLVRSLLHEGTFPAWNPYALSGIPLYSNPQTGLFSPFNLPLWTLPLNYALGVSAALKLLVGGFGAYLLARELRLSFLPGVLAGVAFAFSAVNITWLAHETLPGVVVMAPWALWLVERILVRGRPGSAIALAGVLAVALGGGHPSMQVHVLVVTVAYALVRAACLRGRQAGLGRALALVGGGILAAMLLMAAMLLPEALGSRDTVGIAARQQGELAGARVPFQAILTTIVPDRWGRPSGLEAPDTAANHAIIAANYLERTFYAGTVALLLAFVGLLSPSGWRRKLPFAAIGLAALGVAVHVPGLIWLARNLPGLELVQPERVHFAFELSVALLAAFGLQAVLDAPTALRRRLGVVAVAVLCGVAVALAAGVDGGDVDRTVRHFLTGRSWSREGVLALTAVAWFLLFALGVGALLLVARWRPAWRTGVAVALVLLAAADAYHFVHGFQPMALESRAIPPKTPALAYLERHRDEGRVMGLLPAMPPDVGLVYGLRDVRGYDPPQPTRRMLALWRLGNRSQVSWEPLALETVGLPQLQLLDVLGVRYVIADPETPFSRDAIPTLTPVYQGEDALVLESATAAPRALVPEVVRITEDAAATGRAVVEAGFEARREVAVERDQPGIEAFSGVRGNAAVTDEQNARVTLRAHLDRQGLVVLNDALMDGWSVRVDGRPAAPVHANSVMRGVVVPAGEHEIVWRYAVPGLRLGAVVSAVTFAALVAAAAVLAARRRRASTLRA
jgi:hypothetical protein